MKKIILALVVMLGASQAFAAKTYNEKYREAMEKHLEISGTNRYFGQALETIGLASKSLRGTDVEIVKRALPGVLVEILEPIYKQHLSLKELKRYNRVMNKRAARNFRDARPEIVSDVVLNIEKIGKQAEQYFTTMLVTEAFKPHSGAGK